jgi:succinoglycan biosynthesis transport protein ExoP
MERQFELKKESTVKDFLEVIFRRKWIIIGIVAVTTVSVAFFNLREESVYESSAKMLVKRGESQGVFTQYVRTLSWEEEIASQIEMMKSLVVLKRANELLIEYSPDGYEPSGPINIGKVNSGVIGTSNVIWVTYESTDPIFCEVAVNSIVSAYKEYYQKVRTPPEMDEFFNKEIRILKEEIDYWLDRKEKIYRDWDIVDIREQRRFLVTSRTSYQEKLDDLDQEVRGKRMIIKRLQELGGAGIEEKIAGSSSFTQNSIEQSIVEAYRIELKNLKMEESELETKFTDQNKELIRVRKQIRDVEMMLDEEIRAQIIIHSSQLDILLEKEATLKRIIKRLSDESSEYPSKEVEVQRIESTIEQLNTNYADLLEQHLNVKMTIASNPEWSVTILSSATPAAQRRTRDYVRMALGPLFSIIVGLGFAFFMDSLDHSIKNIAEAEASLGLQVLASFPETKSK